MGFPDLEAIHDAWRQCRRRKRGTTQAQRYETRLLDNLVDTVQALEAGTWAPARSVCFTVPRPKAREIHAAAFEDRVVLDQFVKLKGGLKRRLIHILYFESGAPLCTS